MCRHRAAETAQNVIFFALLAFGFYYYHKLKYFFSETFDDVILDLRVEFLAFGKHPDSNVCHAVRYVDADQGFASVEGAVSYARNTVRYVDAGQGFAFVEGAVSYACHTIRYVDVSQRKASFKRKVSNARHTIWYVDAGQRFTPVKRRVSNGRHTMWYVDAGQ